MITLILHKNDLTNLRELKVVWEKHSLYCTVDELLHLICFDKLLQNVERFYRYDKLQKEGKRQIKSVAVCLPYSVFFAFVVFYSHFVYPWRGHLGLEILNVNMLALYSAVRNIIAK